MFSIRSKPRHFNAISKIVHAIYRNATASTSFDLTKLSTLQEKIADSFAYEESKGFVVPMFKKSLLFGNNIAIKDSYGCYTYVQLFAASQRLASQLSNIYGSGATRRVCFVCPNNVLTLLTFWACWISGQVAVPLSSTYPISLLKLAIDDSQSKLLVTTPEHELLLQPLALEMDMALVVIDHSFLSGPTTVSLSNIFVCKGESIFLIGTLSNDFYSNADAMLLYSPYNADNPQNITSLSHRSLNEQIKCFAEAIQLRESDCVLHIFPINNIHGFINAFFCPLCCGARVIMLKDFSNLSVWNAILGINTPEKERANIVMGVPAIYEILIDEYIKLLDSNSKVKKFIRRYCSENIRIMATAFSTLNRETFEKWKAITGHCLVEGAKI